VARGSEEVKYAYRQVFEFMVGNLEKGMSGPDTRKRALGLAVLSIGGMAVARAVDDMELANEIREAARDVAFSLGEWQAPRVEAAE
jgi:TetR/AcrR family transcriptional repressor of nem operon